MAAAPARIETKPGPRTTEFWAMLFTNGLGILQMLAGPVNVTDNRVSIILGIVNGAYIASRGIAKAGVSAPAE